MIHHHLWAFIMIVTSTLWRSSTSSFLLPHRLLSISSQRCCTKNPFNRMMIMNQKPSSFIPRYPTISTTKQLLSSSTSILDSQTKNIHDEEKIQKDVNRYDIIVRRNKQSMAFRNGSPLVFSGAIESTVTHHRHNDQMMEDNSIPFGSFVGVYVSHEDDNNYRTNNKRNNNNRRKQNGKKDSQNVDDFSSYHHYTITSNDDGGEKNKAIVQTLQKGKLIGYGVYNPHSMYRVRMLCHQSSHPGLFSKVTQILKQQPEEETTTPTIQAMKLILKTKIRDAVKARYLGLNLPSEETDSYRLINGEGDGLSGLAVDVFGGQVAVVMSSASWCEIYKDIIIETLEQVFQKDHPEYSTDNKGLEVIWRNTPGRLAQDGYTTVEPNERKQEDPDDDDDDQCLVIKETNILYKTYPYASSNSQKTGFYCDQRENRINVAKLCQDKRVLDLCCYNGGFALNALIHGNARSCTGVDSSPIAIQAANENAILNNLVNDNDGDKINFVQDDIANFMKRAYEAGEEYDVIVLDPPKLAPSISGLLRASRKYSALNRDAIKLINKQEGGLLLTCTCSK